MSNVTAVPLQPVKRRYLIWLWLGIALALVGAVALARQGDPPLVRESRGAGVQTTASGLKYKVLTAGKADSPRPTDADIALVQYQGRLLDGTTFDRSQQPTPFPVAAGATVPGFSEAMKLLRKGEKARFWLTPKLGYGERANGPIPANATLVFDLEMVDFLPETVVRQLQAQQQLQQQGMGGAPGAAPPAGAMPPR